jgi:hypothetical protein
MRDGKLINVNRRGPNKLKLITFVLSIKFIIAMSFLLIYLILKLIFLNIFIDNILKKYKMLITRKVK